MKNTLKQQGYFLVGKNSAVKICTWTKKSLTDEDVCYKEQFYGIKSHLCCQMTPSLYCCNRCVFCWRDISKLLSTQLKEFDEPKDIIENCIKGQRKLLSGFGGNPKLNLKKFREARNPKYLAISLAGEPLLYEKLSDLIEELKKKNCVFLVSNGMFPEKLDKIKKLPTQFYLSLTAPNKELYKKINNPLFKDYWERYNNFIEKFSSLNTRRTIRMTLIKNMNDKNLEEYSKLINKANPNFVEVKSYMAVGSSRSRLRMSEMISHKKIEEISEKLSKLTSYDILDEKENSRVVLLGDKNKSRKLD